MRAKDQRMDHAERAEAHGEAILQNDAAGVVGQCSLYRIDSAQGNDLSRGAGGDRGAESMGAGEPATGDRRSQPSWAISPAAQDAAPRLPVLRPMRCGDGGKLQ